MTIFFPNISSYEAGLTIQPGTNGAPMAADVREAAS